MIRGLPDELAYPQSLCFEPCRVRVLAGEKNNRPAHLFSIVAKYLEQLVAVFKRHIGVEKDGVSLALPMRLARRRHVADGCDVMPAAGQRTFDTRTCFRLRRDQDDVLPDDVPLRYLRMRDTASSRYSFHVPSTSVGPCSMAAPNRVNSV